MPTYEYRCPNGHEFEHFFRKISDAQPTFACPVCGLSAGRMLSAGAGLVFKGSGFYITDYGKDGKKQERAAAKDATSKPGDNAGPAAPEGASTGTAGDTGSRGDKSAAPGKAAPPVDPPKPKPKTSE